MSLYFIETVDINHNSKYFKHTNIFSEKRLVGSVGQIIKDL